MKPPIHLLVRPETITYFAEGAEVGPSVLTIGEVLRAYVPGPNRTPTTIDINKTGLYRVIRDAVISVQGLRLQSSIVARAVRDEIDKLPLAILTWTLLEAYADPQYDAAEGTELEIKVRKAVTRNIDHARGIFRDSFQTHLSVTKDQTIAPSFFAWVNNRVRLVYSPPSFEVVKGLHLGLRHDWVEQRDFNVTLILLLGLWLGLRIGEISHARLSWLESSGMEPCLHVQPESDFLPKGKAGRSVKVPLWLCALLRANCRGVYLLRGTPFERCVAAPKRSSDWLELQGFTVTNRNHALRKLNACAREDAGQPLDNIQQQLGHRSVEGMYLAYIGHGLPPGASCLWQENLECFARPMLDVSPPDGEAPTSKTRDHRRSRWAENHWPMKDEEHYLRLTALEVPPQGWKHRRLLFAAAGLDYMILTRAKGRMPKTLALVESIPIGSPLPNDRVAI